MEFLLNPLVKKEEWNKFIAENGGPSSREDTKGHGSFLQSYEWGNLQQMSGYDVTRVIVKEDGRIMLAAQIFKHALPLGKSYLYIPYGPVFNLSQTGRDREVFDFFVVELKKLASKESGIIFLKIEMDSPFTKAKPMSYIGLALVGFRKSAKDIQARETMIIDLTSSEDDILARMKQKTRYNIKVAQKHGVKIVSLDSGAMDPKIFVSLLEETAKRNDFRTHGGKYYFNMMDLFLGKPVSPRANSLSQKLYFAYYKGDLAAAALVGFFGGRATFLHGASSGQYRNIRAPYLLHWEIMRDAKRLGFAEYDFWGIVTPRTDKNQVKKWLGFSRFKEGFGGRVAEYPGAYDLVFDKLWYNMYRVGRKIL